MRSTVVWAMAISGALAGCRFDRTPLIGEPVDERADAARRDAAAGDAAAPDAAASVDSEVRDEDAGADDAGLADAAIDASLDAGPDDEAEQPVVPPMTGGLTCAGTFCAFGVDPEKPCCTTQDDVAQRTARAVDRCGLDLGGLPGAPYGDRCWQRDQLGIVDDRCSNLPAASGVTAEPGCCSDEGQCGSINADHKLGCRYERGGAPRACSMETPGSSCDPAGTFAVRFTVDAAWGGRSGGLVGLTDDGRGEIEVFVLMKIDGADAQSRQLSAKGRVCGVRLPAFYSTTLCEAYQPIFPSDIWEAREVPPLPLRGHYECAANGCVLSVDPLTYLLGFAMENPEAPWPAPGMPNQLRCPDGTGTRCFPDHDEDGDPGVEVTLRTEGSGGTGCWANYPYRGAPLSSNLAVIFGGAPRTHRLQLGVRTKLGGTVRLAEDCDSAQGSAIAEYVNSRAAGCYVDPVRWGGGNAGPGGGREDRCSNAEVQFIDQNLPVYGVLAAGERPDSDLNLQNEEPSPGPRLQIVRLGDATAEVECEAVRDANYE